MKPAHCADGREEAMRSLVILRGISGAGKSTFSKNLIDEHGAEHVYCSADLTMIEEGEYKFDPSKLGEGHSRCMREAIYGMLEGCALVIVDNTNVTRVELAPYVQVGSALGYDVKIVHLDCSPEVAALRNVHGVPEESVSRMARGFQPPLGRWPEQDTFTNPTREQVISWYKTL